MSGVCGFEKRSTCFTPVRLGWGELKAPAFRFSLKRIVMNLA